MLVLGVVLVGGGLFYVNYWIYHPIGAGPAGPAVAKAPFQAVWTERKIVLLGFGDSITAATGLLPVEVTLTCWLPILRVTSPRCRG